jgi:beta-lactamase superfamily II metal-dependent hydrolase
LSFLMEGPIKLIARLVRMEPLINEDLVREKANRVSFEFDAIDARLSTDDALDTISGEGDRSRLVLVKILTTADHFWSLTGVDEVSNDQWFSIALLPRETRSGPFAWASSLGEQGYEELIPLVLDEIDYLFSDDEGPLSPVGAAVSGDWAQARAIADICKFPQGATGRDAEARQLLRNIDRAFKVVVRDVGQASFCSAIDRNGNELFHLDAGWPISYNSKTAAAKPVLRIRDAPVLLSHWDWDHLHGYHAISGLAGSTWITPIQPLGPGARRVAENLAKDGRLLGIRLRRLSGRSLRIGRCKGVEGDLNHTGLCFEVTLQSGWTLLYVGDADYDVIGLRLNSFPRFIVATHHGAKFGGTVISPPSPHAQCVVSVGKGNGYGHPSSEAIRSHKAAGWSVTYTCERNGIPRGDRYLGH